MLRVGVCVPGFLMQRKLYHERPLEINVDARREFKMLNGRDSPRKRCRSIPGHTVTQRGKQESNQYVFDLWEETRVPGLGQPEIQKAYESQLV